MNKNLIEGYLKMCFPCGNINAALCEVWTEDELLIPIWIGRGKHTKQELNNAAQLAIDIFEDMFLGYLEPLYALINHWDTRRDIYMFNQFKRLNEGNYEVWESFDETHEVQREQILIKTTLDNIHYQNIMRKFVERDYDETPDLITSRIHFIHPKKHTCFLYFDSMVYVASHNPTSLISYYHKYFHLLGRRNRTEFERHIINQ